MDIQQEKTTKWLRVYPPELDFLGEILYNVCDKYLESGPVVRERSRF